MIQQDKYWNKVAPSKSFTTPFMFDLFSKYVPKDGQILDYGCGYGRTLGQLAKNGYSHLSGVDFSEKMIERANLEYPTIDCRLIKNNKLMFENHFFDSVILFAVLTCVYNDKDQDAIMSEIRRVLKPNGILYINDFLLNTDERNIERYNQFKEKYCCYGVFELNEGAILRHFNENRIKELTHDLEILEFEETVYTTMNGNKSNGFNYIGKVNK